VETRTIRTEEAGQRIDNYLLRVLKGVPRSRIYRIMRRGEVRVNGRRIRADYRLQAGDQLRLPPVRISSSTASSAALSGIPRLEDYVLYEDDRILVLNKPSGMAVHGGSGVSHGVIETLRLQRPEAPYLELVHRLDRETSGCLLIAKRRSELRVLHELLRQGLVEKHYLALVKGRWTRGLVVVDFALQKNRLRSGERVVRVDPKGKPSLSRFTPVWIENRASLMEVELGSGRTHQIRVHAAELGYPLAGDDKYGDPEYNREMRHIGLKRMFLHANSVAYTNPATEKYVHVSAPLADDLRIVLEALEDTPD
jgi:23S rRNA pseudouridine955/2504/2580 synthase